MKTFTYFTESHRIFLVDYFLKSFPFEGELIIKKGVQLCESATFRKKGWRKSVFQKVAFICESFKSMKEGELFMFSDVDVQFFGSIEDDLKNQMIGYDIVCQDDDWAGFCSGFYIARNCKEIRDLFNAMCTNESMFPGDQVAMNHYIKIMNIKANVLNRRYFTVGHNGGLWKGGKVNVPDNVLVHHANWVEGVNNKIKIMKIVKEGVQMKSNNISGSIGDDLFKKIREILPVGKTILELGSGHGTERLSRHYRMYSIEDSKEWVGRAKSNYIYAPLDKDGWYNREALIKGLTGVKYDLILVDGPATYLQHPARRNEFVRHGLLKNLDLFDWSVTVILDDTERRAEGSLLIKLSNHIKRPYKNFRDYKKSFGVI